MENFEELEYIRLLLSKFEMDIHCGSSVRMYETYSKLLSRYVELINGESYE